MAEIEEARERVEEMLELRAADSRLAFEEKQAIIRRKKKVQEWEHARRVAVAQRTSVRTDALNQARKDAKQLRKTQAQKLQVAQATLKEKQKTEAVVVEKAAYRELNESLASLKLAALEANGLNPGDVSGCEVLKAPGRRCTTPQEVDNFFDNLSWLAFGLEHAGILLGEGPNSTCARDHGRFASVEGAIHLCARRDAKN